MRETIKSRRAFEDYYNMGPGRSLSKLADIYQSNTESLPPTRNLCTLKRWSQAHGWQARVTDRNAEIAEIQFGAILDKSVEASYAYWPQRVKDLVELAEMLLEEIKTEDHLWLPDVKQIGAGEFAERVDIIRFNSALITQYRQALDDIAAEMGERVQKQEISGPDGGPVEVAGLNAALNRIYGDEGQ